MSQALYAIALRAPKARAIELQKQSNIRFNKFLTVQNMCAILSAQAIANERLANERILD